MTPYLLSILKDPKTGKSLTLINEEYDSNGNRLKKGSLTVFHNGVLVQNNFEIEGTTENERDVIQ